jgi:UDP-glucose 4-epimerase
MNIGVTGASGFIGSEVLKKLNELGFCVKPFGGDILNVSDLDLFTRDCDVVIHLAGIFSNDFDQLFDINFKGTYNVVESCKRNSVKRLIFSSTGAVYGDPLNGVASFESDTLKPNTLYGLSKFYAEEYIRFSGINHVILRFSNVYGPSNNKGVFYNFFNSIKTENKIVIMGNGEQKRDFLFIDDAVDAICRAIEHEGTCEVFNIAGKSLYSLNQLVEIIKLYVVDLKLDYIVSSENNSQNILSENIDLARKVLKWEPSLSLNEGIQRMVNKYL